MCGKVVHSSGFISTRAVKVEQISPLFHLYLYLFFKSEEHPFFANLACQVNCTDIYGSRLIAIKGEVDLSDFVVAFKFIYFKYIYTRERLAIKGEVDLSDFVVAFKFIYFKYIYTRERLAIKGEVDLSDFVVAFKFIYFKYIYTRERLLLAKSAKRSKGKGVSRSQLQCQATTALRKNSVHLNRARGRVIEINVCERWGK